MTTAIQYQVTEAQKNQIQSHLPGGTNLFVQKHGNWYMAQSDVTYLRNKDSLFDLIIKTEFSVENVDDWVNGLDQYSFDSVERAAEDGFNVYREMIARINNAGGLNGDPTKIDLDIMIYMGYTGDVNAMVVPMAMIRNMMKDGFFEFALRSMEHYIDPRAAGITPTLKAENIASIRAAAKDHGRTDPVLDFAQLTAKGTLV